MSIKARIAGLAFAVLLMMGAGCLAVGCASSSGDESAEPEATETETESAEAAEDAEATEAEAAEDAGSAGAPTIADAEALIGQEMTMDEVEAALGPTKDFTLSAEGCERGVMQGIFYYDGFSMYSRTYDKGKTFTIVSVSD